MGGGLRENGAARILKAYEAYDFHEVVQRLMRFCSVENGNRSTSTSSKTASTPRRPIASRVVAAGAALYRLSQKALVRWMAPIMSFTADEIWGYLPGGVKICLHRRMARRVVWLKNERICDAFWDDVAISGRGQQELENQKANGIKSNFGSKK